MELEYLGQLFHNLLFSVAFFMLFKMLFGEITRDFMTHCKTWLKDFLNARKDKYMRQFDNFFSITNFITLYIFYNV
jgi:hypothetical protein